MGMKPVATKFRRQLVSVGKSRVNDLVPLYVHL